MKSYFKRLSWLLTLMLLLSLVIPFNLVNAAEDVVKITVLGTTDIHGNIYDWSYEDQKEDDDVGLAKVYTIVKQVREENPNTILLDNGDTVQGTVLTDDIYNTEKIDEPNPMIDVMNFMKYDAMTIGNHEFNFGLDLIKKLDKEANFPIISANIYNKEDGSNFVKPYVIKEVAGVKIGILGFTTPNIPIWDGPKVTSLEFKHMADEAEKYVKILKEEEKVDLIIATAHAGLEGRHDPNQGDAAKLIIERCPEIKALLLGHDHVEIAKEINGTLVGAADDKGNQVVRFDLTLQKQGDSWTVIDKKVQLIETKEVESSQELKEYAKKYHEATLDFLKEVLGTATGDFHPESEIPGIPEAQIRDTAVIDLINKVQLEYTGADIAAAALFKSSSNISEGSVTYSDIFDIYKYPNTLYAVEVTGKELKDYMEWSAAYYNTYKPGDITISFNPNIRGYNYDMFAGIEYKIDISKPAGERIVDLKFKGEPVKDDQVFKLAINNYRYGGLSSSGIISNEPYFKSDPISLRSYIAQYIKEKGTIDPEVDNNWEITGADLTHWAKEDAVKLIKEDIIEIPTSDDGRTPNVKSVNLEEKVTRGEFIKSLVKAVKLPIQDIESSKFTDVEADLAPYVEAAVTAGITDGISENLFGPDGPINREQAFTMLIRAIYAEENYDQSILNKFIDSTSISSWAKEELAAAVELGLIEGYADNTIKPNREITRGEMATIISNYLSRFKKIDILSTNDFHGALESGYEGGAAKLAAYIDFYKSGNPNGTVILDAGDAFQGTPISNVHRGKPVIEVMNKIGYDAMAVGNHEFDWGIETVLKSLENAKFKLVSSNIYKDDKLVDWATPYVIVEKNGINIGIIGLSTPETAITAHADYVGDYEFKDPVEIANSLIPEVKEKGADIIVLLGHIPGNQDRETKEISGDLVDLANKITGADAIIGGHSHNAVSGLVNNIPVIEAYKNGRMIGHITLIYDTNQNKIVGKNSEVIEVRKGSLNVEPIDEVQSIVDKYAEELKPIFDQVIGKTNIAMIRDYNNESNIGNWMTDVMKEKANVQIAFTNAGGIREDIQEGDITIGDIFKVMPFDNTIVTGEMTGAQIKAMLEQSVTLYKGMLQISGIKFTYDSTKPEGERVIEITLADGTSLDMNQTYTVATNDFLSGGQDGFVTLKEVKWTNTYILLRDALIEYIKTKGEIAPEIEERIIDVSKNVTLNVMQLKEAA